MAKVNKADLEAKELNILLQQGCHFSLTETEHVRRFPFFRTEKKEARHDFTIYQPPLGILDRLSAELIKLLIDEEMVKKEPLRESRKIAHKYARQMARCIAIAVLGVESVVVVKVAGFSRRIENTKKVNEMTELLMRCLTPSRLREIVEIVCVMGNYADFLNSIRLMQTVRTTAPDLIEHGKD